MGLIKTEKRAKAGDIDAMVDLAQYYEDDDYNDNAPALTMYYYKKAADANHPFAQFMLGFYYSAGWYGCGPGDFKDLDQAFKYYNLSAKNGYAEAMLHLSEMYRDGIGVERDGVYAYYWRDKALAMNCKEALFNMGIRHRHGIGVKVNKKRAAEWFELSARQGHAGAEKNLNSLLIESFCEAA